MTLGNNLHIFISMPAAIQIQKINTILIVYV